MIPSFVEGLRSTAQPCTFLLLAPTMVAVLVAGASWSALAVGVCAAVVGGWALAGGWWYLDGTALALTGAAFGVAVAAIAAGAVDHRLAPLRRPATRAGFAGASTLLATAWWRPCVGSELGAILNASQHGLAGQLPGMTAYMVGTMVPVLALVLLRVVAEPPARARSFTGSVAVAIGVVIGASLASGRHGDVVVTLTRWTQR